MGGATQTHAAHPPTRRFSPAATREKHRPRAPVYVRVRVRGRLPARPRFTGKKKEKKALQKVG
jgi:hypothetical protein